MLGKVNPDFGDSTVCDSVKVRLAYSATYGVVGGQIHLQMAPLKNTLIDTIKYYSNQLPETEAPIADTVLTLDPDAIVFNGVDSLINTLTFDADPAYFQSVIFDAAMTGEAHFADNNDFVEMVPGLHFRDVGTGNSATGYFDLSAGGSVIQLYYHTGSQDTVPKVFNLTFGQNFGDPARAYNQYVHDFSGAAFDVTQPLVSGGESPHDRAGRHGRVRHRHDRPIRLLRRHLPHVGMRRRPEPQPAGSLQAGTRGDLAQHVAAARRRFVCRALTERLAPARCVHRQRLRLRVPRRRHER